MNKSLELYQKLIYETELYYDWVCRRECDDWPDDQLDDKYKV